MGINRPLQVHARPVFCFKLRSYICKRPTLITKSVSSEERLNSGKRWSHSQWPRKEAAVSRITCIGNGETEVECHFLPTPFTFSALENAGYTFPAG